VSGVDVKEEIIEYYEKREAQIENERIKSEEKKKRAEQNRVNRTNSLLRNRKSRNIYQPKDTSKIGKTLVELRNEFPMDGIVKKMVKELQADRPFKYPEEYEVFDTEEELKRKLDHSKQIKMRDSINYPQLRNSLLNHRQA